MEYLAVLLPSVVVGLIFWFAIRAIFNADRSERQALAEVEKANDGTRDASEADATHPIDDEDSRE